MTEIWKDIPGYEGRYQVSDAGKVKSLSRPANCKRGFRVVRERILRYQRVAQVGYPAVALHKDGAQRTAAVHRLVMLAFVGPPPVGCEVCHGNGDHTDNRLANLRYDTRVANRRDGHRLGEIPLGEARPFAKLTAAAIVEIRRAVASGESQRSVAARFGVVQQTVGKIVHRKRWKHVTDPTEEAA